MKLVSWNVRGLGDLSKCHAINLILAPLKVGVLFLQETKLHNPSPYHFKLVGGSSLTGWLHVDAIDTKGGLITAWDESVWSLLWSCSSISILHVSLCHLPSNKTYYFSNVYGSQNVHERIQLWSDCRVVASQFVGPWVMGADFNTTRVSFDRNSGNISPDSDAFNSFIFDCSLIVPPISNRLYTCSNARSFHP